MTWRELKHVLETVGVKDDDTIEVFDRQMFDDLMCLYSTMQGDKPPDETLEYSLSWADRIEDRFLVPEQCWEALDLNPPVAVRDKYGVVHVYHTSPRS